MRRSAIVGCALSLVAGSLPLRAGAEFVTLRSPGGYSWDFDVRGTSLPGAGEAGTGAIHDGTSDATDDWPQLCVCMGMGCPEPCPTERIYAAGDRAYSTGLGGRLIILATVPFGGLNVHREIYVPATGELDYARYVDVFENTTAGDLTACASVRARTAASAPTRTPASPRRPTVTDRSR
jgi:hypothetical protein